MLSSIYLTISIAITASRLGLSNVRSLIVFRPTWPARASGLFLLPFFLSLPLSGCAWIEHPATKTDTSEKNIQCRRLSRAVVRDVANSSAKSHVLQRLTLIMQEFHIHDDLRDSVRPFCQCRCFLSFFLRSPSFCSSLLCHIGGVKRVLWQISQLFPSPADTASRSVD